MELIDDAFQLVSELIRKNSYQDTVNCNIAMENGYPMTVSDLVYSLPETPHYLKSYGLLKIMALNGYFRERDILKGEKQRQLEFGFYGITFRGEGKENIKGLMAVNFNMQKARDWHKAELIRRISQVPKHSAGLPENWGWMKKEKGQYQFGIGKTFTQTGQIRKKVFIQLMDLWEKDPQGISIQLLSTKTKVKTSRLRIEIDAINSRLFQFIGYEFRGDGSGTYKLEKSSGISG